MSIKNLEVENEKLLQELANVETEEELVESEIKKLEASVASYDIDMRAAICDNPIMESPMTVVMDYKITYSNEIKP